MRAGVGGMDDRDTETAAERQLRALERLKAAGMVSDTEYERKRSELVDRALTEMAAPPPAIAAPEPQSVQRHPASPDSALPFPWRWAAAASASLGAVLILIALLLPRVTVSADVFAPTTLGWTEWMWVAIWSAVLGGLIVFTALFRMSGARQLSYGYIGWWAIQASYLGYDAYIDNQPSNWHTADGTTQASAIALQWETGFYLLCAGLVLLLVGAIMLCRWQWLARTRAVASATQPHASSAARPSGTSTPLVAEVDGAEKQRQRRELERAFRSGRISVQEYLSGMGALD
jgi:hypothetical protein